MALGIPPGNRLVQVLYLECSIPRAAVLVALVRGFSSNRAEREVSMNDHRGCEHCKRLIDSWRFAVLELSKSVSRLRVAHNNGIGFEHAHGEAELARLTADNARTTLDRHRYGHE